jgi:hypothetical protein
MLAMGHIQKKGTIEFLKSKVCRLPKRENTEKHNVGVLYHELFDWHCAYHVPSIVPEIK